MQVHDFIADREEFLRRKRFREEVREVLVRLYIWDYKFTIFNHLPNIEVSTIDVLGTRMMFRILS